MEGIYLLILKMMEQKYKIKEEGRMSQLSAHAFYKNKDGIK